MLSLRRSVLRRTLKALDLCALALGARRRGRALAARAPGRHGRELAREPDPAGRVARACRAAVRRPRRAARSAAVPARPRATAGHRAVDRRTRRAGGVRRDRHHGAAARRLRIVQGALALPLVAVAGMAGARGIAAAGHASPRPTPRARRRQRRARDRPRPADPREPDGAAACSAWWTTPGPASRGPVSPAYRCSARSRTCLTCCGTASSTTSRSACRSRPATARPRRVVALCEEQGIAVRLDATLFPSTLARGNCSSSGRNADRHALPGRHPRRRRRAQARAGHRALARAAGPARARVPRRRGAHQAGLAAAPSSSSSSAAGSTSGRSA